MKLATVAILGTLDSKGEELAFVRREIERQGCLTCVIDLGVRGQPAWSPDIDRERIAREAGTTLAEILGSKLDSAQALATMAQGGSVVLKGMVSQGKVAGVIGLGGGKGTALIAQILRSLPIGFPKVLVSTAASGDTRRFVGSKDIWMVSPVTDLMGVNRINRGVLAQAAAAVCAMCGLRADSDSMARPAIGLTSYGVTTQASEACKTLLEQRGYEVLVFHARGTGGQAMEELVQQGALAGIVDLTLSELANDLAGGNASAGPHRLEAAGAAGIPQVVVPGALDVINFGAPPTVPERYRGRVFYAHSAAATLMRTSAEESATLGRLVADKLNAAKGPAAVLIPMQGFSALDREGQPFHDPQADASFVTALERQLRPNVILRKLPYHVNEPEFALQVVQTLWSFLGISE